MRHQPESAKALSGTRLASSGKANVNDEEEKKQGEGKGFAGLSSMVSDVDDVVSSKPKQPQKPHSEPPPKPTAGGSQQPKQTSTKPTSQTYQAPAQPSGGSSAGKWFVGIAVVIGLIWLANQSDNNRPSKSGYSPGSSSTSTAPASQPAIAQPEAPSRPSESKPSVGRNNVLSTAQIRYCLAEKIRLDAAEAVINNYSDSDVDRFNGYVNDYNSRCGEFRYRQGALESARRDVEPYRGQLQAEGRSRFVRSAATTARPSSSTSVPKPARPTPDTTVLAIQRRLNELGYNAGTPDGLFGTKTRAAIQAFQRDNGTNADGIASKELLSRLLGAERSKSNTNTVKQSQRSGPPDLSRLSKPELQSIEAACASDKYGNGPAAYNRCLTNQLAALSQQGGRPNLSRLSTPELQSIEAACASDKYGNGPAAYNRCLNNQLAAMTQQDGRPDLSHLSTPELQSIEAACASDKYGNGPAAYNRCLTNQLAALSQQGGRPDLSRLSKPELQSIEAACASDKYGNGPAAYNRCLTNQLAALSQQGGRPDLSRLSKPELQSVEAACASDKYGNGPAAYNSCLSRQLARYRD